MALPVTKGRAEGQVLFRQGNRKGRIKAHIRQVQFEDDRGICLIVLGKTGEKLSGVPHGPGPNQWSWPEEF